MNRKNMRRLRARLRSRKNPVSFGMRHWFFHNGRNLVSPTVICHAAEEHACGTAACLGGHAALLAWQSGDVVPKKRGAKVEDVAAEWLGLNSREAHQLFCGRWDAVHWLPLRCITKAQAITELTRLIDAETAT